MVEKSNSVAEQVAALPNNPGSNHGNKFEQLGTMLQTPNMYRSASGAPGPKYWQQKADYEINVEIDDVKQRIVFCFHYNVFDIGNLLYQYIRFMVIVYFVKITAYTLS